MKNENRTLKYKTNYIYSNNNETKFQENEEQHIIKVIEKNFNPQTEQYEYKERTINYKEDWENQLQLLEQNELILKPTINRKVKI